MWYAKHVLVICCRTSWGGPSTIVHIDMSTCHSAGVQVSCMEHCKFGGQPCKKQTAEVVSNVVQEGVMGRMQCLQSAVSAPAHWSISSTRLHARPKRDAVKLKVRPIACSREQHCTFASAKLGWPSLAHSFASFKSCSCCCLDLCICGLQQVPNKQWLCVSRIHNSKAGLVVIVECVVQGHIQVPYDVSQ